MSGRSVTPSVEVRLVNGTPLVFVSKTKVDGSGGVSGRRGPRGRRGQGD